MNIAKIDIGAAQDWSNRVKAEIEEIAPIINQVDRIWEAGPTEDTITGAIAEKVSELDESWIRALDSAWKGIDAVVQVIINIWERIQEEIARFKNMF